MMTIALQEEPRVSVTVSLVSLGGFQGALVLWLDPWLEGSGFDSCSDF